MQNTRLTRLLNGSLGQFNRFVQNPWRRIVLLITSVLLGNFLATAVATSSGQAAEWDIVAGILLVAMVEVVNWFVYRRQGRRRQPLADSLPPTLLADLLNGVKIGLSYGMFLEAFKLGS